MKRDLPDVRNLSTLSFQDYIRLMELVKQDGKLPTETVTQHNNDPVSYKEAYKALKDLASKVIGEAQQANNYTADLFSSLATLLVKKHIINEKELNEVSRIAQRIWEEENNDKTSIK